MPLDLGAHLDEAVGDVDDLGLARGILDHGLAPGERRRHQGVMGGADRDLGERDPARRVRPLRRLGDDIAALELDLGAQRLERHQVQIDGPRADGAAAGQRHLRLAAAGEQRRQHPEARPHARHHLVGRGGVDDVRAR